MPECQNCGGSLPPGKGQYRAPTKWCSDNCRKRAHEAANPRKAECVDCGADIHYSASQCRPCRFRELAERKDAMRSRLQSLWLEGYTGKEIAQMTGTTADTVYGRIDLAKRDGWSFPPHRSGWTDSSPKPGGPPLVPAQTKDQARQRLLYAVRMGRVTRPSTCEDCGTGGLIEGHHHDYSKPLDVRWLCRACHLAIHYPAKEPANA